MQPPAGHLLRAFAKYRSARLEFLQQIGRPNSNRDPLAEFSECLVAQLLGGRLAASRVQKDYDVIAPDGRRVEVKCLANPRGSWVNERDIEFRGETDAYAIVFFEELEPTHVLVIDRSRLAEICRRLGKRHEKQDTLLRMTRRNFQTILANAKEFEPLGVQLIPLLE